MAQPLAGIRILDLTRLLPGPYMTMLLADLGAEVIKIETPLVGDYARIAPAEMGVGGLFDAVNRNKKSLALNFRNPRGRDISLRRVEKADVVIEGFRPGAVEHWRIDYPSLQAVNPRIVYLSLSGYGQSGPYRDRAGHDLNYMAVGGGLDLIGEEGGPPIPCGMQIADLGGGMLAAIAILAALIGRERLDTGMYLDVALMDVVPSWVNPLAGGGYFSSKTIAQRGTTALSGGLPCYNVYETADGGYLSVGALEPHFWKDFCEAIERPDLIERHLDKGARSEVASVLRGRDMADWMGVFSEVNACVEPIHDIESVLEHPQIRHRGFVMEKEGEVYGLASPFVFTHGEEVTSAPALGEHSRQILEDAGLKAVDIDPLIEDGIVKQA